MKGWESNENGQMLFKTDNLVKHTIEPETLNNPNRYLEFSSYPDYEENEFLCCWINAAIKAGLEVITIKLKY